GVMFSRRPRRSRLRSPIFPWFLAQCRLIEKLRLTHTFVHPGFVAPDQDDGRKAFVSHTFRKPLQNHRATLLGEKGLVKSNFSPCQPRPTEEGWSLPEWGGGPPCPPSLAPRRARRPAPLKKAPLKKA